MHATSINPGPGPKRTFERSLQFLRLLRLPLVLSAIADAWLVVFLAYGVELPTHQTEAIRTLPLWAALGLAALLAGGLHTSGVALNDLLDRRKDRLFSPDRPVAAGRIGRATLVIVAFGSMLAAMAGAIFLGRHTTIVAVVIAVAVLFYNATGRFLPSVGILSMAMIRALNMVAPNPMLGFGWPVVVVLSHVMVAYALGYWLEGRRPRLRSADIWALGAGWVFWMMVTVRWVTWRSDPLTPVSAWMWICPIAAVLLFAAYATWVLLRAGRSPRDRRRASLRFLRSATAWLMLYDAAFLIGAGLFWQAGVIGVLIVLAVASASLGRWLQQWAAPPPRWQLA